MLLPASFMGAVVLILHNAMVSALPQASSCTTITSEVVVPTTTYTWLSTYVTTTKITGALDLGTFTEWNVVPETVIVMTVATHTVTDCSVNITVTSGPVVTACGPSSPMTTASPSPSITSQAYDASITSQAHDASITSQAYDASITAKAKRGLGGRDAGGCTVTVTTTAFEAVVTGVPANVTRTFSEATDFTMETVFMDTTRGTSYSMATATTTTCKACTSTVTASSLPASTVTCDPRCAPSAIVSARGPKGSQYGIVGIGDVTLGGVADQTTAPDASQCCQLCAEREDCAGSAWDVRSHACHLEFPADPMTGNLNCGEAGTAWVDAESNGIPPGAGWYVADFCGKFDYEATQPDDGT